MRSLPGQSLAPPRKRLGYTASALLSGSIHLSGRKSLAVGSRETSRWLAVKQCRISIPAGIRNPSKVSPRGLCERCASPGETGGRPPADMPPRTSFTWFPTKGSLSSAPSLRHEPCHRHRFWTPLSQGFRASRSVPEPVNVNIQCGICCMSSSSLKAPL